MRKTKDLIIKQIAGDYILINPLSEIIDMTKVYTMNETAAYIWENISETEDFSISDIIKLLEEKYELGNNKVEPDIDNLLTNWENYGLITK